MANTREHRIDRARRSVAAEQKQVDRLTAELADPTLPEKKRGVKQAQLERKTKRLEHAQAQLAKAEAPADAPASDEPSDPPDDPQSD